MIPVFETALCSLDMKGGQEVGWAPFLSSTIWLLLGAGHGPSRSSLVPSAPVLAPGLLCCNGGCTPPPGPGAWPLPAPGDLKLGLSGLRNPHSQSCSGFGSWDWGSGRGCVCGCGSRGCDCCSFRGCGPGWGCGWDSCWSSRCSGSWTKRRGWAGSRGWAASGHCQEGKGRYRSARAPALRPSGLSLRPKPHPAVARASCLSVP